MTNHASQSRILASFCMSVAKDFVMIQLLSGLDLPQLVLALMMERCG